MHKQSAALNLHTPDCVCVCVCEGEVERCRINRLVYFWKIILMLENGEGGGGGEKDRKNFIILGDQWFSIKYMQ